MDYIKKNEPVYLYELEYWYRPKEIIPYIEKENDAHPNSYLAGQNYIRYIGYYTSRRSAEYQMRNFKRFYDKTGRKLCFSFIRRKIGYELNKPGAYEKEWTFLDSSPIDESILPNYGEEWHPFHGRPIEKILHKKGDIVMFIQNDEVYWGIICGLPPSTAGSMMDYTDDCYVIIINSGEYMDSHRHIPTTRIFPPDFDCPEPIRKALEARYSRVALNEDVADFVKLPPDV